MIGTSTIPTISTAVAVAGMLVPRRNTCAIPKKKTTVPTMNSGRNRESLTAAPK